MAGEYPAGCVEVESVDKYLSGRTIALPSPLAEGKWTGVLDCRVRQGRKQPAINSDCPNWRRFILDESEDEDENGIKAIERVLSAESDDPTDPNEPIEAIEQA